MGTGLNIKVSQELQLFCNLVSIDLAYNPLHRDKQQIFHGKLWDHSYRVQKELALRQDNPMKDIYLKIQAYSKPLKSKSSKMEP